MSPLRNMMYNPYTRTPQQIKQPDHEVIANEVKPVNTDPDPDHEIVDLQPDPNLPPPAKPPIPPMPY